MYFPGLYFLLGSLVSWGLVVPVSLGSYWTASVFAWLFAIAVYAFLIWLSYKLITERRPPIPSFLAMFDVYLLVCYGLACLVFSLWMLDGSPGKNTIIQDVASDKGPFFVFLQLFVNTTAVVTSVGIIQGLPVTVTANLVFFLGVITGPYVLIFLVGWSISYFYAHTSPSKTAIPLLSKDKERFGLNV